MYNNKICDALTETYGLSHVIIFCKMESAKYKLLAEEYFASNQTELYEEALYESKWWMDKGNDIKKTIKNQLLGL